MYTVQHRFWYLLGMLWIGGSKMMVGRFNSSASNFPSVEYTIPDELLAGTSGRKDLRSVEDFRIHHLPHGPSVDELPFKMYAGDLSVREDKLKNQGTLFFWLFESQTSHRESQAPLVIWLNGGYVSWFLQYCITHAFLLQAWL
jgi:hypothetical protein